ncbi:hypothetical protein [Burkholderia guangdongensis]|uniref:hypothetical protein n=1 Tax=Burkholderia guangdongensis TaxID=1792500 RepID=UPI0015C8E86B|nr:hypothetical protein [Burkholderia guangdongensis]
MMKTAVLSPLALALVLAACTSASGPTFNAYQVNPQDGVPTYRVECHGLVESSRVCQDHAREICHDQIVRPIEERARLGHPDDARTLTFQCGALPAESSVDAAPVAASVELKHLDLAGDANFEFDRAELTPRAKE